MRTDIPLAVKGKQQLWCIDGRLEWVKRHKPVHLHTCHHCEGEFRSSNPKRKYCSDKCRDEARLARFMESVG